MKNYRDTIVLGLIALFLFMAFQQYLSGIVDNTDLEPFIGKWGASREQIYFAKTDNGLSMSIYRSPTTTMTKSGNYLYVKDLDSLQYVENAGGRLYFTDGHLVFDYFVTPTEKLLFVFQKKYDNTYIFSCKNDNGTHTLKLTVQAIYFSILVTTNNNIQFSFNGDKMKY